jgi:hypothetical protein
LILAARLPQPQSTITAQSESNDDANDSRNKVRIAIHFNGAGLFGTGRSLAMGEMPTTVLLGLVQKFVGTIRGKISNPRNNALATNLPYYERNLLPFGRWKRSGFLDGIDRRFWDRYGFGLLVLQMLPFPNHIRKYKA